MLLLKFMDTLISEIDLDNGVFNILKEDMLPCDLDLSVHNSNFKNIDNFRVWCANRTLTMSKANAKKICNVLNLPQSNSTEVRSRIALAYKCLTLDDAYWVDTSDNQSSWLDITLHLNKSTNVLTPISLCGKVSTLFKGKLNNPVDLAVNGTFAKSWIRDNKGLYLCKADESEHSDETINEVLASKILKSIGANCINYELDIIDGTRVSKCACYTSEALSFIPYSILRCKDESVLDFIKSKFKSEYANMVVATYLIGNEDLHDGNWGLLLDNSTFEYIGLFPLFDFNYSLSKKSYISSKNNGFIPEMYYVDMNTGNRIKHCNVLDFEYEIVSNTTIEQAAVREYLNCTLDLDSLIIPKDLDSIIKEELLMRINTLKKSFKQDRFLKDLSVNVTSKL